jgi:polar amino acid transport system substrate-binding protein
LIQRFLVLFFLLLGVSVCSANEVWRFTALHWVPYSDEHTIAQGKTITKLRQLLLTKGIVLEVDFYPWRRAQLLAMSDERYLGYLPAWPEEVREGFIASQTIDWSSVDVLAKSGSDIQISTIEELFRHYSVGVVSTYVYPEIIKKAVSTFPGQAINAMDEESLVLMLESGRVQAAITDANVMRFMADQAQVAGIQVIKNVMTRELVVAFKITPENHRRVELLNALLRSAKSK